MLKIRDPNLVDQVWCETLALRSHVSQWLIADYGGRTVAVHVIAPANRSRVASEVVAKLKQLSRQVTLAGN